MLANELLPDLHPQLKPNSWIKENSLETSLFVGYFEYIGLKK